MTETGEIILAWLKDEFPKQLWNNHERADYNYANGTQDVIECLSANIGGVDIELKIAKDLTIGIYTKTPFKSASKVREVRLTDPTSITGLQEVVKHIIRFTTNPYWTQG